MGFLKDIKVSRERKKLIDESRSPDWGIAEDAIRRVPDVLDLETALSILLPLSQGKGSRLANPLSELPATPTYEFSAGVHLKSSIAALGKLKDVRASTRLAEIVTELPNFASQAFTALGSPCHAAFSSQLANLAENWPRKIRSQTCRALWGMETKEALEAYIKIKLEDGSPFSEDNTRKAWAARIEEIKNPKPKEKASVRPLPLP